MPLSRLKSYLTFRSQSEELLGFAILVSYAVPALKDEATSLASTSQVLGRRPDFFHQSDRSTIDVLMRNAGKYEERLASYLLLTEFSFFEAFVVDSLSELIEFHGGEEVFLDRSIRRTKAHMRKLDRKLAKFKRDLQTTEKKNALAKYWTSSRQLAAAGYRFPGELFSPYGLKTLIAKLRRLKAHEIPSMLVDAFQVDLTPSDIERFHEVRNVRNAIAHGDPQPLTMRQVVEMNIFLRDLAIKIARHLSDHFLVIENQAP